LRSKSVLGKENCQKKFGGGPGEPVTGEQNRDHAWQRDRCRPFPGVRHTRNFDKVLGEPGGRFGEGRGQKQCVGHYLIRRRGSARDHDPEAPRESFAGVPVTAGQGDRLIG